MVVHHNQDEGKSPSFEPNNREQKTKCRVKKPTPNKLGLLRKKNFDEKVFFGLIFYFAISFLPIFYNFTQTTDHFLWT